MDGNVNSVIDKKIDNIVEFKASEIAKLASLLSLGDAERSAIFFAPNVIINHLQ